jgi:hypothetical protein
MMTMHPVHALLVAKQIHHERVARADAYRRAGRTAAATDCLIPVAPAATRPCRPDPRRTAATPAGRTRTRRAAVHS